MIKMEDKDTYLRHKLRTCMGESSEKLLLQIEEGPMALQMQGTGNMCEILLGVKKGETEINILTQNNLRDTLLSKKKKQQVQRTNKYNLLFYK